MTKERRFYSPSFSFVASFLPLEQQQQRQKPSHKISYLLFELVYNFCLVYFADFFYLECVTSKSVQIMKLMPCRYWNRCNIYHLKSIQKKQRWQYHFSDVMALNVTKPNLFEQYRTRQYNEKTHRHTLSAANGENITSTFIAMALQESCAQCRTQNTEIRDKLERIAIFLWWWWW